MKKKTTKKTKPKITASAVQVLVLQRGWVVVGRVRRDGPEYVVEGGSVIRRWGSVGKGLGYIAENGPTAETVLDKTPTIRAHELTVVLAIDAKEELWRAHLSA